KIAARDVSLTLEHQSDTSILNIFPAIVDQILPEGKLTSDGAVDFGRNTNAPPHHSKVSGSA
ncbi:MAG: hypothetical protein MK481_01780, partial [SAR324 cluster bacterium]|nr:hypothetical protein [SAR324 cluster bacterium]